MQIAIGSDHAGFALKEQLKPFITSLGHDVHDVGTHGVEAVDYPDFVEAAVATVLDRSTARAILICGSGVGASVAANKFRGIRAGLCHDHYSARQGVEHDDMNVLVLGGRVIGDAAARDLVAAFLGAAFSGDERHVRRLDKVRAFEARPR